MVTFLILVIDLVLLPIFWPRYYREENWTVLKELLYYFFLLFTLGVGNLVYSTFIFDISFTFKSFLVFQSYTLLIGIIPVTAIVLIKQSYLKKKNESSAVLINEALTHNFPGNPSGQVVRFLAENQKEELTLSAGDILFIKSDGNYITVGFLNNGRPAQLLMRNTMKYAAELLASFPFLYQCHRSWIVNLNRIARVSGNSQGLRIAIEGIDEDIPVARKNTQDFRERIAG